MITKEAQDELTKHREECSSCKLVIQRQKEIKMKENKNKFTASNGITMLDFAKSDLGMLFITFVNPLTGNVILGQYQNDCVDDEKGHRHIRNLHLFFPDPIIEMTTDTLNALTKSCLQCIDEKTNELIDKLENELNSTVGNIFGDVFTELRKEYQKGDMD